MMGGTDSKGSSKLGNGLGVKSGGGPDRRREKRLATFQTDGKKYTNIEIWGEKERGREREREREIDGERRGKRPLNKGGLTHRS